jgi:hypothetical protein
MPVNQDKMKLSSTNIPSGTDKEDAMFFALSVHGGRKSARRKNNDRHNKTKDRETVSQYAKLNWIFSTGNGTIPDLSKKNNGLSAPYTGSLVIIEAANMAKILKKKYVIA